MARTFVVVVDPDLCKGCGICIHFCTRGVFEPSSQVNSRGYRVPLAANDRLCTGCLLCEHLCPDLAISIQEDDDGQ